MIFLGVTPRYLAKMCFSLQFQFLFGELWYFLFSGAMLSSYLLPLLALVLGVPFAHVGYAEFLGWSAAPTLSAMAVILWIKKQGLLRPANGKILSWEMVLFQLARWPWVVCAIIDAVKCSMTKTTLEWKITPRRKPINPRARCPCSYRTIIIVTASSTFNLLLIPTSSRQRIPREPRLRI